MCVCVRVLVTHNKNAAYMNTHKYTEIHNNSKAKIINDMIFHNVRII